MTKEEFLEAKELYDQISQITDLIQKIEGEKTAWVSKMCGWDYIFYNLPDDMQKNWRLEALMELTRKREEIEKEFQAFIASYKHVTE